MDIRDIQKLYEAAKIIQGYRVQFELIDCNMKAYLMIDAELDLKTAREDFLEWGAQYSAVGGGVVIVGSRPVVNGVRLGLRPFISGAQDLRLGDTLKVRWVVEKDEKPLFFNIMSGS
jgi:hypothetical protein